MRISSAEARKRGYDPDEIARIELAEEAQREADQLRMLIDQTFLSIPKPRITLRVARAFDNEWTVSAERIAELALEDRELDWREVEQKKTEAHQEYFTFSDPEGWRFYLPAYMCHYLSDFPNYGYDAVYQACVSRKSFDELSEQELGVVDRFLELCGRFPN